MPSHTLLVYLLEESWPKDKDLTKRLSQINVTESNQITNLFYPKYIQMTNRRPPCCNQTSMFHALVLSVGFIYFKYVKLIIQYL